MKSLLYVLALLIVGCGEPEQPSEPKGDTALQTIRRLSTRPSSIFGFVQGDSAVTTLDFSPERIDTVTIFWVPFPGPDRDAIVIVEFADGTRAHLHEEWLNPIGYKREERGE